MIQTDWTSLGNPPATIKSSPSLGQNADGRLEVFTIGSDGALWHIWQVVPNGNWSNWNPLNKPPNTNLLMMPGVQKNADGRLEVFTIGSDGALWHIWQIVPNGNWSNWSSLGKPTNAVFSPLLGVHINSDGRLELFAINSSDGALWHIWQIVPNGNWSNWSSLGKPPNTNNITTPIVSENQDGRLEAFVIGSDGALWHIWQTTPGASWGTWSSLGGPATGNIALFALARENWDGRLEVFVTVESHTGAGVIGMLWHIWQVVPNGNWSNWSSLGKPTSDISIPSVGKNADGRLEAFVIGSDGALWHIWQLTHGGTWGSWSSLDRPSSSVTAVGDPFVTENADGRLEAFTNGSDGALWHCWQVSPGGLWGSSTTPLEATSATVTITPASKDLANTYVITGLTGHPDPTKRQVQARILTYTSPTETKTARATGSIPEARATGTLTFLNTSSSPETFSSVVLTGASGVPVSFNGPITVPAAPPASVTVSGFAVNVGSAGNIRALDINGSCCAPGITVKNGAFSGGQDPQPNSVIQQSDIDSPAEAIVAALTPGAQADLKNKKQPNEEVAPNTFQCKKSTFLADHRAGDIARIVTVTVAITCKEEVYDKQAALRMAESLLTQEAVKELGPVYALTGNIVTGVTQATVVGSQGTVSLLVKAEGMWVYTFSESDQQNIKNHLTSLSQPNALQYLKNQAGVSSAQIELSNGNTLPSDPAKITIVIKPVTVAIP